ncbi:MAG: SGNH/GDSL hydrolase family protein [Lachnospiraceae bacterium]|nr:SGNH/GDSL hydrolase family protein [Lachnospiraceae bacterium]
MKKIAGKLKELPLVILIALIAVLLGVFARWQYNGLYMYYETDPVREPFFTPVMEGIGDGVYPWHFAVAPKRSESHEMISRILEQQEQQAAAEGQSQKAAESAAAGTAENGESGAEQPAEAAMQSAEQPQESTAEEAAAQEAPAEEVSAAEEPAEEVWENGIDPDNPTHIRADSMPEGVCSPVMPADDYGVVSKRYLAPEGTTYAVESSGMFAENGDYYLLREVNDYYFTDALFIGDSRTVGLMDYGNMKQTSNFFAREMLSIYNLWDKTTHVYEMGNDLGEMTLLQLLATRTYHKIYISVGVNELGIPTTVEYYQRFREALGVIRQLQPDAIIYIQGIMHVSKYKSSTDPAFNNTNIVQRNSWIASLANGRDIFYLDMNPDFCDEHGDLIDGSSYDGVHLQAKGYQIWHNFLWKNGIVRDPDKDYRGAGPEEKESDLF